MSVLSRLFGRKPQPETRENKITSLDTMAPEALVRIALSDAKSETDERVRAAAIQKLDDEKVLSTVAFGNATPGAQRSARQRLAELIDSGKLNFTQLSQQLDDPLKLFAIMSFSQQPERLEQLLASLTDQDSLHKIALEGATAKLRQLAAEKITDKSHLQQLLKDTKGKDKTVYKIVKDKCDQFREEEKLVAATQASIDSLAQAIEQHSHRPFDAQFAPKFHHLQQQWQVLAEAAAADIQQRTQLALEKCQALINSVEAAQAEESAKALELASADQTRHKILQTLGGIVRSLALGDAQPEDLDAQIAALNEQWRAALTNKTATANELKTFVRLNDAIPMLQNEFAQYGSVSQHTEALASVDQASLGEGEFPALYRSLKQRLHARNLFAEDELPQVLLDAQAAIEQWNKLRADKKAEAQTVLRHIGGLIRKANDAAKTGRFQQAAGLRRAVEEKLSQLEKIPTHLHGQLQQLDENLEKLQDWKDYAVVPKKHDLIAQMKALLDSKDHPEGLANKIKRLQDEWKGLSKGGGLHKEGQDQELWEEFHQLAQTAYQPCRDYFAEQAALRQKNLDCCKALVEQLTTYCENYDWQNADWKAVEKVLQVARQEWRSYAPTERAATQPVQAEFDRLLEIIDKKLNEERTKNHGFKQSLVGQAQQLLDLSDQRKAVDEVKRLQTQWQQVGITVRAADQKLWREFRAACDAVFAKKQQQSVEFKEELEVNLTRAEVLTAEVFTLTETSGQALIDARKRVEELRQDFNNIGPLPKAKMSEVKTAFAQAVDTFEQKVIEERSAAKQQVWINLFEANNTLRLCQLAMLKAKDPDAAESLLTEARDKIAAITQWPTGGLKAIQQKLESALMDKDLDANELVLRNLCIRAEILTGCVTPAADQTLRMAYQVKQLEQNFGQKLQDIRAEFDALIFEWLAAGPVKTAEYETLFNRFNTCRIKAVR